MFGQGYVGVDAPSYPVFSGLFRTGKNGNAGIPIMETIAQKFDD
jgi:hypothetical protein